MIHIIGADHVECQTEETLQQAVGPLVRWLNSQRQQRDGAQFVKEMNSDIWIEMLGPNVPIDATRRPSLDLLHSILKSSNGFQSVSLVYKCCVLMVFVVNHCTF